MPIIDDFVIGGGHFEFLYNDWRKKWKHFFLLIYGLSISGKKHSFKINMNMTQKSTLTLPHFHVIVTRKSISEIISFIQGDLKGQKFNFKVK